MNDLLPVWIEGDPWLPQGAGEEGFVPATQALLAAVIAADPQAIVKALGLGGDPVCAMQRTRGKECSPLASISLYHPWPVAQDMIVAFEENYPHKSQVAFWRALLETALLRRCPQETIDWLFYRSQPAFEKHDKGWLWRRLATRQQWDLLNKHMLPEKKPQDEPKEYSYTLIFVWARCATGSRDVEVALQLRKRLACALAAYENQSLMAHGMEGVLQEASIQFVWQEASAQARNSLLASFVELIECGSRVAQSADIEKQDVWLQDLIARAQTIATAHHDADDLQQSTLDAGFQGVPDGSISRL